MYITVYEICFYFKDKNDNWYYSSREMVYYKYLDIKEAYNFIMKELHVEENEKIHIKKIINKTHNTVYYTNAKKIERIK